MRDNVPTLRIAAWLVGSIAVLPALWIVVVMGLDLDLGDADVNVALGIMIAAVTNWWLLYSRLRGIDIWKAIGVAAGGLVVIGALGALGFDADDLGMMLGPVLITSAIELVALGASILGADARNRRLPRWLKAIPRWLIVFFLINVGVALTVLLDVLLWNMSRGLLVIGNAMFLTSCWALYAFLRNRQIRQDELVQVLAAAVASQLPLAPTLRSYLAGRPQRGPIREAATGLAYFLLPHFTYVRMCIGWQGFDELVRRLAERLEEGESLSSALRSVPGVANRGARLLAVVGEKTDSLALCLQAADRERWTASWLEIAPRIVYPLVVLFVVLGVTSFVTISIIPKYKKIFDDFGMRVPATTGALVDASVWIADYSWLIFVVKLFALVGISVVVANPTVRWQSPVIGQIYRSIVQASILRALGRLFAVGRTAPEALMILCDSGDLPTVAESCIDSVEEAVQRGRPLDEALQQAELLPAAMAPLVRAAGRTRTMPWALSELGDLLANRSFARMRRLSLIVGPLMILAIGILVAFIALALFLPLLKLISSL